MLEWGFTKLMRAIGLHRASSTASSNEVLLLTIAHYCSMNTVWSWSHRRLRGRGVYRYVHTYKESWYLPDRFHKRTLVAVELNSLFHSLENQNITTLLVRNITTSLRQLSSHHGFAVYFSHHSQGICKSSQPSGCLSLGSEECQFLMQWTKLIISLMSFSSSTSYRK